MLEIDIHERIVLCIEEGKKQGILKTSEYKELLGYLDEWFAEVEKRLTDGLKMPNDLEEAADKYAEKLTSEPYLQVVHKTDFIAGAKWQEGAFAANASRNVEKTLEDASRIATRDRESSEAFLRSSGIMDGNGGLDGRYRQGPDL